MTRHDAEVHEALVRSRNLLDRDGWAQRSLETPDGRHCANGAMNVGSGGLACPWEGEDVAADLRHAVRRTFGRVNGFTAVGSGSVLAWNNAPGRTKAEVLAAFDRAINATAPEPHDPLNDMAPTSDTRVKELVRG